MRWRKDSPPRRRPLLKHMFEPERSRALRGFQSLTDFHLLRARTLAISFSSVVLATLVACAPTGPNVQATPPDVSPTATRPAAATATAIPPRPSPTRVAAPTLVVATLGPTIAAQSTSAAKSQQTVIDAGDYFFNPVQLTISSGTTLTWRNVGGESHNVVARDSSFSSSSLMPGERFTFTFRKSGRYAYVCTFHEGDGMFAEVTVE